MNKHFFLLSACFALTACDKAVEKLSEKAIEKAIEAQMSKDGKTANVTIGKDSLQTKVTDANGNVTNVSIGSDGIKSTSTDASGKVSTTEIGGATVTEADVGVPFYPGAIMKDGKGTKMVTPDGTMISVDLESKEEIEKVAEYYRGKFKGMAKGRTLNEMSQAGESTMLVLADEKSKEYISLNVSKNTGDSNLTAIHISVSKGTPVK